jgi:hypothetical protein
MLKKTRRVTIPALRMVAPTLVGCLFLCLWTPLAVPSAHAQETTQSIATLYKLLDDEREAVESERKALNKDCSIVWSRETAKIAQCEARRDEVSRKMQKYQRNLAAYEERKARLEADEAQLAPLDERIASTEKLLKGYVAKTQLMDYERSVQEWTTISDDARRLARDVAIEGLVDVAIDLSLGSTKKKMDLTTAEIRKLAGVSPEKFLLDLEKRVGLSMTFEAFREKDMEIRALSILKEQFMIAERARIKLTKDDYWDITLRLASVLNAGFARNPQLAVLITGVGVATTALYTGAARYSARERIKQLVAVREQELIAMNKLTALYTADIKKRNDLRRDRDRILTDAGRQ